MKGSEKQKGNAKKPAQKSLKERRAEKKAAKQRRSIDA
jgi:hypothetical protein